MRLIHANCSGFSKDGVNYVPGPGGVFEVPDEVCAELVEVLGFQPAPAEQEQQSQGDESHDDAGTGVGTDEPDPTRSDNPHPHELVLAMTLEELKAFALDRWGLRLRGHKADVLAEVIDRLNEEK